MRSWGLVETFHVDRPSKPPEKCLRLSPLGRRAFDEALGQFLDKVDTAPPTSSPASPP
jgi:DNA-binding PadR family transcriptional regulator